MGKTNTDILPFEGGASEGSQAFTKKVKELKNRFKKKARKASRKKRVIKTEGKNPKKKSIKMKKGPKQRNTKAKEGLFLSKKTTLNSLISKMNFVKVPLTQLLSQ